ncbi:Aste57867_23536 [Aphanomyces stellatus]|uniref:Aste57867_23536 protein n=1 Tax=Aphanomyces stellatus TaxID=120398 RepID=A0A485LMX3_9STRA|nr:hypothetical protein As57867_023465 [Aphanomyces stellatus]VFU00181.1 Aste57867_23536 [Aphanomyces stellatus]
MALVNRLAQKPLANTDIEYVLEKTIAKIGRLLQGGFGSASTEIISKNMNGTGELNVMVPGKNISSIFGYEMRGLCDPENKFIIDAAERSKKRADIGVPLNATGTRPRTISPQGLVDSVLVAVLRMRVEVYLAGGRFQVYWTNKMLQEKFDNHIHVAMGFGLHIGWAVEGAIGSKFKIHASYLISNINMAARLENTTGQFQCDLIRVVHERTGPIVKSYCRKVDRTLATALTSDPNGVHMPMDFEQFPCDAAARHPARLFHGLSRRHAALLGRKWDGLARAHGRLPRRPTDALFKTLARESSDPNGDFACPTWWKKGFRQLTEKYRCFWLSI